MCTGNAAVDFKELKSLPSTASKEGVVIRSKKCCYILSGDKPVCGDCNHVKIMLKQFFKRLETAKILQKIIDEHNNRVQGLRRKIVHYDKHINIFSFRVVSMPLPN